MFNPCFPLRRAYLLLFMLSQPIPLYLKQAFELLCFTHPYIDPFNHVYYLPLFSTMLLSKGIYLWKLSMIAKSLFCWAYGFCYISSVIKRLRLKISIVCSLFSDQELRFAITNYDLPCASLFVISFYLLQVYIIWREVAVYYNLCLGECDASCPYFVYWHFTP
jgi:hypothetical protein